MLLILLVKKDLAIVVLFFNTIIFRLLLFISLGLKNIHAVMQKPKLKLFIKCRMILSHRIYRNIINNCEIIMHPNSKLLSEILLTLWK